MSNQVAFKDIGEPYYRYLKLSGMLWEIYPQASGSYTNDMKKLATPLDTTPKK